MTWLVMNPTKERLYQDELNNAALEFIETTDEQPFFLFLAYASPHAALQVRMKIWYIIQSLMKHPTLQNRITCRTQNQELQELP